MKTNILRYALLLCLTALVGTASCSGTTEPQNPDGPTDDPDKLTELTIDPITLPLTVNQTVKLTAKGKPETASLAKARWSSDNKEVAMTGDDGAETTLTAVGAGSATITVNCGGIKGLYTVTVKAAPIALQKIDITPNGGSVLKGESIDLKAALVPENADVEGEVVWASDKPDIATVDQQGRVTAVADGLATITATLGDVAGSCSIEVYSNKPEREFTFFQFNIWEGLANVDNGLEAFIQQLAALQPDAASFCEFPSAGAAVHILGTAAAELKKRTGIPYYYNYHSFNNGTRGLLTRHPILSEPELVNGNDWFYRSIIDYYGREMALYASHAYHSYYACYLPRGYNDGDGTNNQWGKLTDEQLQKVNEEYILEREKLSGRGQIGVDLAADMNTQKGLGRLCVFGGDLNQPSHLDWTERTKDMFEHKFAIPWSISKACYEGGVRDAFRTIYPDEVKHPGVTWPVSNKDAKKVTQWAAEADERDRIDYVYYMPDEGFQPVKAQMVGPSNMISHSKIVPDTFVNKAEELIEPVDGIWPSDHRGLFVTFKVKFE